MTTLVELLGQIREQPLHPLEGDHEDTEHEFLLMDEMDLDDGFEEDNLDDE